MTGVPDTITRDQAEAILRSQFPELTIERVEYLGEGCDSVAFEVDGQWVFRFPKRSEVEAQLLLELRALPVLAQSSPVSLPQFRFRGRPTAAFPYSFAGYARLPGIPGIALHGIDPRDLARPLASFLSWLHTFPLETIEPLGVPRREVEDLIGELRMDALDDLLNVPRVAPEAPVDEWRAFLSAPPPPGDAVAVLVHGDFAAEHVLVDPEAPSITGVIDWSELAIGDAAIDFAGLFHWGGQELAHAVLETYRGKTDDGTLARARYLAACRGAADIAFGVELKRPEYVRAGLGALRSCIG